MELLTNQVMRSESCDLSSRHSRVASLPASCISIIVLRAWSSTLLREAGYILCKALQIFCKPLLIHAPGHVKHQPDCTVRWPQSDDISASASIRSSNAGSTSKTRRIRDGSWTLETPSSRGSSRRSSLSFCPSFAKRMRGRWPRRKATL